MITRNSLVEKFLLLILLTGAVLGQNPVRPTPGGTTTTHRPSTGPDPPTPQPPPGSYQCAVTLFSQKGATDSHAMTFQLTEQCKPLDFWRNRARSIQVSKGCVMVYEYGACFGGMECFCPKDLSNPNLDGKMLVSGTTPGGYGVIENWDRNVAAISCCDSSRSRFWGGRRAYGVRQFWDLFDRF